MIPNQSPWIRQLARTRPVVPLATDVETDIAIVGGGIAGISTAYFLLRDTDKRVVLVEADKVAHGATGHNAGQLTSYFERSFSSIAVEYGLEAAADGQRAVESAWAILDTIMAEGKLITPVHRFTGYTGVASFEQLSGILEDNRLRKEGGLPPEDILIAEESGWLPDIDPKYEGLYQTATQKDVLALIESDNGSYYASVAFRKGCMNSALFTEEVVGYLIATYPDRFSLYEGSPVETVTLTESGARLTIGAYTVSAARVILATNGFEHFHIKNEAGPDIDTSYHHMVEGRIGYMAGYIEPVNSPPTAISYLATRNMQSGDPTGESYFYLTRRPHEHEGNASFNLVCAGGPEKVLPNQADYSREDLCHEEMRELIDDFLRDTYAKYPSDLTEYAFCWHGLMGYTPGGIRRIGFEPRNPVLMYNLGCNGVGILPSLYGATRIADLLTGKANNPMIFDPVMGE